MIIQDDTGMDTKLLPVSRPSERLLVHGSSSGGIPDGVGARTAMGAYDGPMMDMVDFFNLDNGTDYHY